MTYFRAKKGTNFLVVKEEIAACARPGGDYFPLIDSRNSIHMVCIFVMVRGKQV